MNDAAGACYVRGDAEYDDETRCYACNGIIPRREHYLMLFSAVKFNVRVCKACVSSLHRPMEEVLGA